MAVQRAGLRIAHIDAERGFSGGEVQVFLLMQGLAARGHDNLLLCPPQSAAEAEARRRGIACATVPMRNDFDVAAVGQLARHLRANVDLVHLHTGRAAWLGALAARLAAVPAIVTRRMDRPVRAGLRTRLIYQHLTRRTVAIAPGVVTRLTDGGVPASRITCIASAVDLDRVQPRRGSAALRAEHGASQDDRVLLTLSSLVSRKGVDVLLDAVAMLRGRGLRPLLWIAGEGPERAALTAQAARLGLEPQLRWLGAASEVGDLLAACDVFVLPSRREGLGVAALEAMAAGRPVVASAVGGLGAAVVDGRTGLLVPPDDPPALAEALATLLGDAALRSRLGTAGPGRIAEGFLPEQMVEAYVSVYREVLAGGAR
jgi:glycosyltransferase involved in cell wall biosynthesis